MTINILVADDSPTARQMFTQIINATPGMAVIGEAVDGHQAVKMTCNLQPDLVLMDLIMPGLTGVEATREIMHLAPTPVVVVSASLERKETESAFQALKAGALATVAKPVGVHTKGHEEQVRTLIGTIKAMAAVEVIHHWKKERVQKIVPVNSQPADPQIVGIVSSTGGPAALCEVLQQLPAHFPLPIVIVQHIAPDFLPSLQSWLAGNCAMEVVIAKPNTRPSAGVIHLAPGNAHLHINAAGIFELDVNQGEHQHMPAGNELLGSIAKVYRANAIGIVLTGMGADGARGLRMMYDAGAYTIAQDEASCVVYGMPREAVALGAVQQVLPLSDIAKVLLSLVKQPIR